MILAVVLAPCSASSILLLIPAEHTWEEVCNFEGHGKSQGGVRHGPCQTQSQPDIVDRVCRTAERNAVVRSGRVPLPSCKRIDTCSVPWCFRVLVSWCLGVLAPLRRYSRVCLPKGTGSGHRMIWAVCRCQVVRVLVPWPGVTSLSLAGNTSPAATGGAFVHRTDWRVCVVHRGLFG